MKQLAGTMFIRNGEQFDYCYMEAIDSMLKFCDAVFVVDAGSNDGTLDKLRTIKNEKFNLIEREEAEWFRQKGKGQSKLCYFTDIAIEAAEKAGYEYSFYCQADEVVHEKSYADIRKACGLQYEGYMVTRVNLWGNPYYELNVEHDRMPCSKEIIRLTKTKYRSVGDAESIAVPQVNTYFINGIKIYHMGFVRDREKMVDKSIHMQESVFELGNHDVKLDGSKEFKPERWFDPKKDLKLISEPLPESVKDWAKKRVYKLN